MQCFCQNRTSFCKGQSATCSPCAHCVKARNVLLSGIDAHQKLMEQSQPQPSKLSKTSQFDQKEMLRHFPNRALTSVLIALTIKPWYTLPSCFSQKVFELFDGNRLLDVGGESQLKLLQCTLVLFHTYHAKAADLAVVPPWTSPHVAGHAILQDTSTTHRSCANHV